MVATYDFFVSYAEADGAWVEGYLLDSLQAAGIRCHSEAAFRLGVPRILEFESAIRRSQRTLLVLSPAYIANSVNQFVDLLAQFYGLETGQWPVIPLILRPVQLPLYLNTLTKLDATNEEKWQQVIKRLCDDVQRPVPNSLPKPLCPYPGMIPFSEADSERFFGRDQEVEQLINRLRLYPFVSVIGPSGSGKSSLVFAGLVPALRDSRLFGSGEWLVRTIRPGEMPITALESALGSDLTNPMLAVTKALSTQPNAQRLLLVVDQLEEVFTVANQQALPFQNALLSLVETPNSYVIVTVRADFYPDLMESPLWPKIQSYRRELLPLDAKGLHQAIIKPAENVSVFIEAALIERLVTDAAGEPGVLPLIQETLVLLWEKLERRFLPLRAYEALVLTSKTYRNFDGSNRTGLQAAIANRADVVVVALDEKQRSIARRIFLRLIQFGEGRADTRRQQSVNALRAVGDEVEVFDQTLLYLADCRLVTLSGEEEDVDRKVDIAHESLISAWPALQWWLNERREAEQIRRRLMRQVEEWIRLGKDSGGLLDKTELAEAGSWLSSPDADDLGRDETMLELIEASERKIQQEEEKERKSEKTIQRRAIAASIFAVAAITAAISFLWQLKQARQEEIKNLTASSEAHLSNDEQIEALLVSVEAGEKLKKPVVSLPFVSSLPFFSLPDSFKMETVATLAKAVYEVQEFNRLEGHSGRVRDVSFSPNGERLASASDDNTVKLWSKEGKLLQTLKGHSDIVTSVSFSPDSEIIASTSRDTTIKLWSKDGELLQTLEGHQNKVTSVSFSPDGNKIVSGSDDSTVKLWSKDGKLLQTLDGHESSVTSVSFSPDGNKIVSGGKDGKVKLWNLDGEKLQNITHGNLVTSVNFSPDGQRIASASEDGIIKLWIDNQGSYEAPADDQGLDEWNASNKSVNDVSFSVDGQRIATADEDNTVQIWDLEGDLLETLGGHQAPVKSVSFSPNKDIPLLASAGDDNSIKLWMLKNQALQVLKGDDVSDSWKSARFSPNGQILASINSGDNIIKLWQLNGGRLKNLGTLSEPINNIRFSPDSQKIASFKDNTLKIKDNTLKIWDLNGNLLQTLPGHSEQVTGIDFSPDGKFLASTSSDQTIKLWSINDGQSQTLGTLSEPINNIRFSPDGQKIASLSDNNQNNIKIWDLNDKLLQTLPGHNGRVMNINFSPDSKVFASSSFDQTIKLWNLNNYQELATLKHSERDGEVVFSPNGKFLASIAWDNRVKLWSLDGREITTLKGSGSSILKISFSEDSKILAATSGDNQVAIWNLELEYLLKHGCNWLSNYLTIDGSDESALAEEQKLCKKILK
ncbi:MAG: TIR domain-containing protein [Symploca sp. SIO1C2]|nr:TIR domain-containing protein [Symploca sp. SIO1C2]